MLLDGDRCPVAETVNEMVRQITPPLIKELRLQAGGITQAKLADNAGVSPSQISRYVQRDEAPEDNIAKLADGGQISVGGLWWLFGRRLQEIYAEYSAEAAGQTDEVKEPRTPYGEHRLNERVEAVLRRDLRGLDPHSTMALTLDRQLLRRLLSDLEDDLERGQERIEQALEVHEQHYQDAVRREPGPRRA